ncbi:hypothetical protein LOD99_10707 [Oopsacas minuta]|uniref:Tc1-like transposase DDE domain-containing protein n=1 Tax=Oopsacas minuta TaxID=111878 RepID=A0AAV7KEF5_9METZ|nr:hypothetical protein LOD99_10707 [Oopsacas minuta]
MKRRGFTCKVARKIPMLTQTHKAYRVDWAKSNRCRDWEKVIFSDEMSIWLAGGRVCAWCKGDSKPVKLSTKHSPKLHVWGSVFSTWNVSYQGFQRKSHRATLLRHSARMFRKTRYMEEKGIHRMDWPACSPDLNPIENLWSWIKREIDLKSPRI